LEGKGCVAEALLQQHKGRSVVIGENAPNSGHTCRAGSLRALPAGAFFADAVILGPDAVIDLEVLTEDWSTVCDYRAAHGIAPARLYIHVNAAHCDENCVQTEQDIQLRERIASTCTGGGAARYRKHVFRQEECVIGHRIKKVNPDWCALAPREYMDLIEDLPGNFDTCVFECGQGLLLDTNFGHYPYVTSRSTLPQAAVARNGLARLQWHYVGVYRTFPIRVGGNSGPTGGTEISWSLLKRPPEHGTVTGRERRVFTWSNADFDYSLKLAVPDQIMVTHLDYLDAADRAPWLDQKIRPSYQGLVYASENPCNFTFTSFINGKSQYYPYAH
jgi:adenylosuccinate synthase